MIKTYTTTKKYQITPKLTDRQEAMFQEQGTSFATIAIYTALILLPLVIAAVIYFK